MWGRGGGGLAWILHFSTVIRFYVFTVYTKKWGLQQPLSSPPDLRFKWRGGGGGGGLHSPFFPSETHANVDHNMCYIRGSPNVYRMFQWDCRNDGFMQWTLGFVPDHRPREARVCC